MQWAQTSYTASAVDQILGNNIFHAHWLADAQAVVNILFLYRKTVGFFLNLITFSSVFFYIYD